MCESVKSMAGQNMIYPFHLTRVVTSANGAIDLDVLFPVSQMDFLRSEKGRLNAIPQVLDAMLLSTHCIFF